MGRELLMPDELMRFKFGESIFIKTRMHPVKATSLQIDDYGFKVKHSKVPSKSRERVIDVFNLDEYRERIKKEKKESLVDIA